MSRHKRSEISLSRQAVPDFLATKARSPLLVVLGSPAEVVNLLSGLPGIQASCYQLDLFQAGRLRSELAEAGLAAEVVTAPDVWDLPAHFQSAIYMPARSGERQLKIDMVDQVYHVLVQGGAFFVWTSYVNDPLFTSLLKKVFGRARQPSHQPGEAIDNVLWCMREEDHPRRRHEITFQARIGDGPSCRFVSRPGTFSYGRFDNGARALCEVMEIEPGDRVLDLGCGIGTNGVFAAQRTGPTGHIAFVDSNVRAIALAEVNARGNGVADFQSFATATVEGPAEDSFDVVLANPPYYADSSIARVFIERARKLLTPQGRFFLVTRQPQELGDAVLDSFEEAEAVVHRGYTILCA